jgi:Spa2 homology domain (SHD) of GIT
MNGPNGMNGMNGMSRNFDGMPAGPPGGARRPSVPASQAPSPPPSIANSRSSDGTLSDQQSRKYKRMEDQLAQHFDVLKRYLNGGQPQPPRPNKARDKLLRLSATQFHELSTDVYDELIRRQAATPPRPPPGRPPQRPPNVPPFLLPRSEFHEKRNQARQKLSSLQPQRFRDLATDVFCELERRFPHFKNTNISRRGSPSASIRGSLPSRGPTPNGFRPGPPGPNGYGGPPRGLPSRGPAPSPGGFGINGPQYPPREGSLSSPPPGAESLIDNGGLSPESDYGKPMPKQFQSNTITPNKSTMVEDEEDEFAGYDEHYENDRPSDAYAPDDQSGGSMQSRRFTSATTQSGSSAAINTRLAEAHSKAEELQSRIDELELNISLKDEEIGRLQDVEQNRSTESDWIDVKHDLEKRLEDAEMLNRSMKDQLDEAHTDQANVERDLRSQLDKAKRSQAGDGGWKTKYDQLERDHKTLQANLREQQQVTEEVRQQASGFLNEMRTMAESGGSNWEREEKLGTDVRRLEEEVREWKSRYAKSKAQLRNLRASSIGLSMSRPDAARYAKANEFTQSDGLVKDIHVTQFQMSIDELLRIARTEEPAAVLGHMKSVVLAVRSITQDIEAAETANKDDEKVHRRGRLKSKVSATANNVITASKNFASSNGISPVSLLDAAASHLTMAVVELVRAVKIRPTPPGDMDDDEESATSVKPTKSTTYFNVEPSHTRNQSANESIYSAVSTPPVGAESSGANDGPHVTTGSKTSSGSTTASGYGSSGGPPAAGVKLGFGIRAQTDGELEDLKVRPSSFPRVADRIRC